MNTEWLPVVGFPLYEINRAGEVRRAAEGDRPPGETLTHIQDQDGYPRVHLSLGAGRQKSLKVHRALLEAFVGPPPEAGMFALHADDDPQNLSLDNLRWGTRLDNRDDARANGRLARIADWRKARTHCPSGHEFTESNTRHGVSREGYGYRACRACGRDRQNRYLARRSA